MIVYVLATVAGDNMGFFPCNRSPMFYHNERDAIRYWHRLFDMNNRAFGESVSTIMFAWRVIP